MGRPHVLPAEDVEKRRPRQPRDESRPFVAENERGKDQPVQAPRAGRWDQAEGHRKQQDEQDREEEAGDRHTAEGEEHDEPVDRRVAFGGRNDPEHDPEGHREDEGGPSQLDRARQPIADHLHNGLMADERLSQIEMRRVPQPAEVLNRQRIVQAELVPELRDELLLRRAVADTERGRADHRVDRISRDQVQDREDQQRGEQQHRDRLDKPLRDELGHAPPLVPAYTLKLTSSSSSRPPARPVARAAPAPPAGGRCGR